MSSAWANKRRNPAGPFVLAGFLFLLTSCGTEARWYKPGHFQADFDKDALECEVIAHEMARQATMTGRSEDQERFVTAFNTCLYRKGWSTSPPSSPGAAGQPGDAHRLAALAAGGVQGFGLFLPLPAGFSLRSETAQAAGPVASQSFLWEGRDSTFIQLVYQKTVGKTFEPIDYVVVAPFFLYERGTDEKRPDFLRWAVFTGEVKKNWVVGLGAYVLASKEERIIVVVTRPLIAPETSPPQGLRLSKGQRDTAENFMTEWQQWLAVNTTGH